MPATSLRTWERRSMPSKKVPAPAAAAMIGTRAALMPATGAAGAPGAAPAPAAASAATAPAGATVPAGAADTVYRHGLVYTVDAQDSVQQALAIRAGRIGHVGSDAGLAAYIGPKTMV